MAHLKNEDRGPLRRGGGPRGAHEGEPYCGASRYNPMGEGPTTPRDGASSGGDPRRQDSWDRPQGTPSVHAGRPRR